MQALQKNLVVETMREKIDLSLKKNLDKMLPSTELTEACRYAVLGPGKRLRPLLLLLIAKALGDRFDVMEAACAIEFFHAASLIADDLPSMDNDALRRGDPSLHKVYGEAVAIMASYALISQGYEAICSNTASLLEEGAPRAEFRGLLAVQNVARNAGIRGATGGQFLDLKIKNPTNEELEEVLSKKTSSIFEISSVLGWLFGGGDLQALERVQELAAALGMAFQIFDDLEDLKKDSLREISPLNYAFHLGEKEAKKKATHYLEKAETLLLSLKIQTPELLFLLEKISRK